MQFLVCCLSNGALSSIQSYSCAPYVTLSAMAYPLMAFLVFFQMGPWVATGAHFSYVKVVVAGMCRTSGYLFSCGVVTQICSAIGAAIMFILVHEVMQLSANSY